MADKIKVSGYSKKINYDGGIEYRPFSPDLVGVQLASNGGMPLLTMGNFAVTTNIDPKLDKFYNTSKFSNFLTLSDLNLTLNETNNILKDNAGVFLNLDKTNLDYYALFGSLREFIRVSLEDIIINWPASLFLTPLSFDSNGNSFSGYTIENYFYNSLNDSSTFKVNTTFIRNKFNINYTNIGTLINTFNETNELRNFTINYNLYSILYNNTEYDILGFTASTYQTNDYIYLNVNGNPFSGQTNALVTYHIKPNKINEEKFFNSLPNFESYLLNRLVTPIYTSTFKYPIKSDSGLILFISKDYTWPVSDGYNIDFDSSSYSIYANKLLDLATNNDLYSSNLMNRFLVSESISDFDTTPVHLSDLDKDTSGQKINKVLQIYGRSFDEINNFIYGIKFSNTVTYDKEDNTPDIYLKNIAKVLGWDLISSVIDNDLLSNYITTKKSTYSGHSIGLSPVEADIELWRRLILNSPWIWKSKGARKSIEFLLRFIGAPKGLIKFNEYIYKADAPLDIEKLKEILTLNGLTNDLSGLPIDEDGFPKPLPNSLDMYFQNDGLWYRETGGTGATIDITTGNNPHIGVYDSGNKYISQFECLIPNFKPVSITSLTETTDVVNLYTNYNLGTFDDTLTSTTINTVEILSDTGEDLSNCVIFTPSIEIDPKPKITLNDCGCENPVNDKILSLCISEKEIITDPCSTLATTPIDDIISGLYSFQFTQKNLNGTIYKDSDGNPILRSSKYGPISCCKRIGGTPVFNQDISNGVIVNSGYLCCDGTNKCGCTIACKWLVNSIVEIPANSGNFYLQFIDENGQLKVVTPDGCNCVGTIDGIKYTSSIPNITDPITGEIGYACQLAKIGILDLQNGNLSKIRNFYLERFSGIKSCYN